MDPGQQDENENINPEIASDVGTESESGNRFAETGSASDRIEMRIQRK